MKWLKKHLLVVCFSILMVINVVVLNKYDHTSQKLMEQQSTTIEIKDRLQSHSKRLQQLQTEKTDIESSLKEERLRMDEVRSENESLKESLQAKKKAQTADTKPAVMAGVGAQGNATCVAWLAELGIPEMASATELQRRENGNCDPQRYNMDGSGACGLAQELPCGKSGCGIPPNADGKCQLKWMHSYVISRYGSWTNAVSFHDRNNWY